MPGLKGKLYKDHLKTLELPSLSYIHKQGDAIQMFQDESQYRKPALQKDLQENSHKLNQRPPRKGVQARSQKTWLLEQPTHGTTCLNMPSKHQTSIASKTELTSPGRSTTTNSMHLLSGQHLKDQLTTNPSSKQRALNRQVNCRMVLNKFK